MRNIFFLLVFFTLVSCTKDSEENSPASGVVLLKKIQENVMGTNGVYQFYYNGTKLTKVTFQFEAQTDGTGYYKYQYTGDIVTGIKEYDAKNKNTLNVILSYDEQGRLSQVIEQSTDKDYALKYVYTYNTNGTVEVMKYSGNSKAQDIYIDSTLYHFQDGEVLQRDYSGYIVSTDKYQYDNAFNPMQNVTGLDKIKLYANNYNTAISSGLFGYRKNLSSITTYVGSGGEGDDSKIDLEAVYNDNNYPSDLFSTSSSPGGYQYHYEYY